MMESYECFVSVDNSPDPPIPPQPPLVPPIDTLAPKIIQSSSKLFFISHRVPGCSQQEWSLVQVALKDSLKLHPHGLQDGKFLVEFYMCHPSDKFFDAPNQRYWLEYHPTFDGPGTDHKHTAHLIRPSASSKDYAKAEGLTPF